MRADDDVYAHTFFSFAALFAPHRLLFRLVFGFHRSNPAVIDF